MDILAPHYTQLDKIIFLLSLGFFFVSFAAIIAGKVAGRKNAYTAVNRVHMMFGVLYVISSLTVIHFKFNQDYIHALKVLAVGLFCYYTFHYVFLFQVIGLIKKSVSVNFLSIIKDKSGNCSVDDIHREFGDGKGFSFVKADRLNQMTHLEFAREKNGVYKITPKGRVVNGIGSLVLKLWGVERL